MAGLGNIGLLDTTAGDAETCGPVAAVAADDTRHVTQKATSITMVTAAATATLT